MHKRSLGMFVLAVSAGLFAAWLYWGLPAAEFALKETVETSLSGAFGQPVTLREVRIHPLLLSAALIGPQVGPAEPGGEPLFTCDRWTFQVSPLRFTTTYPWFALALGHSIVENPVVRLPPRGGGDPLAKLTARPLWLAHQLEWRGASVRMPAAGRLPALSLEDSSGFFRVTPQKAQVVLKAESGFGPVDVSAELHGRKNWTAAAALHRLDLASLERLDGRLAGRLSGNAVLRLSAKGSLKEGPPAWSVTGTVQRGVYRPRQPEVSQGSDRPVGAAGGLSDPVRPFPSSAEREGRPDVMSERGTGRQAGTTAGADGVPFEGSFSLSPEALTLENVRLFGKIAATGQCRRPFQGAELDIDLKSAGLDVEEFRRALPATFFLSKTPVAGSADLAARVEGPASDPRVEVRLDVADPRVAGVSLPSLKASVQSSAGAVDGVVETLNGRVAFSRRPKDDAWALAVRNLELAEAARANDWGRIAGAVNGQFRARGDWGADMSADGAVRIERVAWGVHQETAPIAGRLTFRGGKLTVQGPKDVFHVDAAIGEERVLLSRFSFEMPSGLSISVSGSVERPAGELAIHGTVRRVPLREVPMLLSRYPEIDGTVDLDGALSGTVRDPSFIGRGAVQGLKLRAGAPPSEAEATVRWDKDGFSLSSLDVDGVWKGEGRWARRGAWSLDFSAERAPAALPADLLGKPGSAEGALTGRLRLSGAPGTPLAGEADLSWSEGRLNDFAFRQARGRLAVAKGSLSLQGLEVEQASGVWKTEGTASLAPGGPFHVVCQFKNFAAGRLRLDGEVSAKGTRPGADRVEGDLRSPNFWVNGAHVGAFESRVSASPRRVTLMDLRAAGLSRGDLALDVAARTLQGRVEVRDLPLSEWSSRFADAPRALSTGQLTAFVDVAGGWASPTLTFTADWKGADWNGFAFDNAFRGQWREGVLRLQEWTAALPEGGRALAQGTVSFPPDGPPAADLALDLSRVPLHEFVRVVGWAPAWRGSFDGKLSWKGPLADPSLVGEVSGKELRTADGPLLTEWAARLRYRQRELRVDDLSAKTPEGVWRLKEGSRAFLTGEGQGHLQLVSELRNIHAGPLTFFGGLELVGQWKTRPQAALECTLRAQSLWINQQRFDQDLARLSWSGDKMTFTPAEGALQQISGEARFDQWPQVQLDDLAFFEEGTRRFWIHGEAGPKKWDFELEGAGLDAKTLIGLADLDLPMEGAVNVRLTGQGSPKAPRVEGDVEGAEGRLGRLPYDRVSAHVLWDGPSLHVTGLEAAGRGRYVLRGEGRLPTALEDSGSEDFAFSLRLTDGDLSLLKEVWPHCRAAQGAFRGELHFKPRRDGVQADGYLIVEDGRIRADRYFNDLNDLNARLLIKDNRLVFENCSARFGTGRLLVQGDVGIQGFDITDYDLSIESVGRPGVEIEVPQLAIPPGALFKRFSLLRESLETVSRGRPLVFLKVRGPDGEHSVMGTVIMDDTQFTYPPAKGSFAKLDRGSWLREFWTETNWDVTFKTGEDTWYRNEFVNVRIDGDVRVFGKRGSMGAEGKLTSERGVITYLGQSYRVKNGAFEVVTDTRTAVADRATIPYLSGVADRNAMILDTRGVPTPDTITMIVDRRPVGEIQPRFVSRNWPDWSSDQVVKKTFGISDDQVTPGEKDQLLRAGLVQLLGSAAGPLANRLADRFGIDILYPIYERSETEAPSTVGAAARNRDIAGLLHGTGASAGVQLSNRVFGLYKFKVDQTLSQNQLYFRDELELIYRVGGNLHLRASTELDSEKLLGQPPNRQAVLENQWRFGQPKKQTTGESGQQPAPAPAR